MKAPITALLIFLFASAHAQTVKFSQPESRFPEAAGFEIIGHINDHYLIFLSGIHGTEIGVYDEAMNKVKSIPTTFIKITTTHTDFFTYQDHFLFFFQNIIGNTNYISALTGDSEGAGMDKITVLDSIVLPTIKFTGSKNRIGPTITTPPFLVLRSENKQWFMILKGVGEDSRDQQLDATLYDKDLKPVEHARLSCPTGEGTGKFADFVLDNDGDLAFILSNSDNGEAYKILTAGLFVKPKGTDSLRSMELSVPDVELDHLNLQVDNANHRYILNSLFKKADDYNLSGLCSMIWDKRSMSMTSTSLTSLPSKIRSEARSDFSPPNQVLNYYYLRQVFPFADGGFMVLAEMCYGREKFSNYYDEIRRSDFIWENTMLFTLSFLSMNSVNRELPGTWMSTGRDRFGNHGAYGVGRNTDNLLVFFMDREGRMKGIKVIHKSEYTTPGMETLSYQAFNDGNAIHLLYNENIKGQWLPVGTSIRSDGTIAPEPVLHSVGRDQLLFPRYGKQVGLRTAIVPCQIGEYLGFARVDY